MYNFPEDEEYKRRNDAPSMPVYECQIIGQGGKEEGQQVVWLDMYFVSGQLPPKMKSHCRSRSLILENPKTN